MPFDLVTGGASSGKSGLALDLLRGREKVTFIATGIATDDEMARKIERHRKNRPLSWRTLEVPTDVLGAMESLPPDHRCLLLDDLTFWVTNLIYPAGSPPDDVYAGAEEIADALSAPRWEAVVVTNEIGMGIIPPSPETRRFRVTAGRVNQIFAERALRVHLVVSGVPVTIKGGAP
jgi:adenosylcobinamide kinase/adenosylcobinamide-phosphate guanylyltransferase